MRKVYTVRDQALFEVSSEELAPWLIGKVLCFNDRGFIIRGRIWATEAYRECDGSSDANRGTAGQAQLLSGGHLHYHGGRTRLDIVAGKEGTVSSVLIRGIDPYGSHPQIAVVAMGVESIGSKLDGLYLLEEGSKPEKDRVMWLEDDGVAAELDTPKLREGIPGNDLLGFEAKAFVFKR